MAILTKDIINNYIDKLDNKEIQLITELVLYQDQNGEIQKDYVYYKDIAKDASMSERHFYNIMESLTQKGIIIENEERRTFKIKGNTVEECKKENGGVGYITVPEFVSSKEFFDISVKAKRLIIKLLCLEAIKKDGYFHIGRDKLMEWVDVDRTTYCNDVLKEIGKWFDFEMYKNPESKELYRIKLKNIYRIDLLAIRQKLRTKRATAEVKFIFRKRRINVMDKVVKDFAQLMNQYKDKFYKCLRLLNKDNADGRIFRSIIEKACPV